MPSSAIERLASAVDHTLLDPAAGPAGIDRLCDEALHHRFAAVCVHGAWVARCRERVGDAVAVAAVVSFPHGMDATAAKCDAARGAVACGASELDVVICRGLLDDDPEAVLADLAAVVETARAERAGILVKAIVEAPTLDAGALALACAIVARSGADFAKSGTGTAGPVTVEQVRAMRAELPATVRLKASGGIRTPAQALALLEAGADRLGTSGAVAMLQELDADAVA